MRLPRLFDAAATRRPPLAGRSLVRRSAPITPCGQRPPSLIRSKHSAFLAQMKNISFISIQWMLPPPTTPHLGISPSPHTHRHTLTIHAALSTSLLNNRSTHTLIHASGAFGLPHPSPPLTYSPFTLGSFGIPPSSPLTHRNPPLHASTPPVHPRPPH